MTAPGLFQVRNVPGRGRDRRYEIRTTDGADRIAGRGALWLAVRDEKGACVTAAGGGGPLLYWEVSLPKHVDPEAFDESVRAKLAGMTVRQIFDATRRRANGFGHLGPHSDRQELTEWIRGRYRDAHGGFRVIDRAQAAEDLRFRSVRLDRLDVPRTETPERSAAAALLALAIAAGEKIEPLIVGAADAPMPLIDGRLRARAAIEAGRRNACAITLSP